MKFKISITAGIVLGLMHFSFAQGSHIVFTDSARHHQVNIGAQLVDSLAITNLTNAPTHYDNSASVRLFLNGHFTERFLFNASVKVSTDHTNKEIYTHLGYLYRKRPLRLGCS